MKIHKITNINYLLILHVMLCTAVSPALACFMYADIEFRDILKADAVIEGFVVRYEFVATDEARRDRERYLADLKARNEERRREEIEKEPVISYALLTIRVERVLLGNVPQEITVTWSSDFVMPKSVKASLKTFALRDPRKGAPSLPLRSGSGIIWPVREPDKLTLLRAPCASEFMFDADDERGRAIAKIFDGVGDPAEKMELYLNPQPRQKPLKPVPSLPMLPQDVESGNRIKATIR